VVVYLGGTTPAALDKHNIWYSFGIFSPDTYAKLPNTLVIVTLISNFGTFLLYMMTCIIAIVAFREHQMFNGFKHFVVPVSACWQISRACSSISSGLSPSRA